MISQNDDNDNLARGAPLKMGATEGRPDHHIRVNSSFLAVQERNALLLLAARTPATVTPNQLTLLGVLGALVVFLGLLGCWVSPWFVGVVTLGLATNWLGDSLDGTLARYRGIERPDFGYLLDHSCDLISQTLIFVGLGFSPYFTIFSGLIALSMYLLFTSYTYLKVLVLRTHNLSYYGFGATELRLLILAWSLFALVTGPGLITTEAMGMRVIDVTIGAMGFLVFLAFVWKVWTDIRLFREVLA